MHISYYVVTSVFYVALLLCIRPIHKNKRISNNVLSLLWAAAAPFIVKIPIDFYSHGQMIGDRTIAFWTIFAALIFSCGPMFYFAVQNQVLHSTNTGIIKMIEINVCRITLSRKDILFTLLVILGEFPGILYSVVFLKPTRVVFPEIITSGMIFPIAEEIIFRLILPIIFISTGRRWLDIMLFSVIFAFMHFYDNGNVLEFMSALVFSIYCYFLMKKTNSIMYPILFHILYNIRILTFS